MSLVRYTVNPWNTLQQQINNLFDQIDVSPVRLEGLSEGSYAPPLDLKEDADAYHVMLEVPGVPQDKLNLSLQDNVLTIKGHKEQTQRHNDSASQRIERNYGGFTRMVALPQAVDGSKVAARLENGILSVTLPKEERAKPRQIAIGVEPGTIAPVKQKENTVD